MKVLEYVFMMHASYVSVLANVYLITVILELRYQVIIVSVLLLWS